MPSMISSQPVVAEGDIASTEDVWLLRLGGTPERIEAHAMVGSFDGGGVAVGTTLPVPTPDQLYPQWAFHHGRNHSRVLLAFLTAPEVDHIKVVSADGATRRMNPVYRHPDPPVSFFLDDVQHVPVLEARSYGQDDELLATADLSSMDTSRVMRVVGPDNHLE